MEHSVTCRCNRKYKCNCDSNGSHYINFCQVCYSLGKEKKKPILYGAASNNIFDIDLTKGTAGDFGIIPIVTPKTWPVVVPEEERKKSTHGR